MVTPSSRVAVANSDALLAAAAGSPAGTTIELASDVFRLERNLILDRPLVLCGPDEDWACLVFAGPKAGLRITADGCVVRDLALSSERHRAAPLLRLAQVSGAKLSNITLVNSQGSGMEAQTCRDLELTDVVATGLGAEALIARDCDGMGITATCRSVGQAHQASAVVVERCTDFKLSLDVTGASGSALTIRGSDGGAKRSTLALNAADCLRGLTVIGSRERPLTQLSGTLWLRDYAECGVMLSNVEALDLKISIAGGAGAAALRLTGGYGARDCALTLEIGAEEAVVRQEGGSKGNRITSVQYGSGAVPAAPPAAPVREIPAHIAVAFQDRFTRYEVTGRCSLCGWSGAFRRTMPSERETLACGRCHAVLRYRGQAEALLRVIGGGRHATLAELCASGALHPLAIFEPGVTGPLRPYLSQAGIYRSSIYRPDVSSGTFCDGSVCQDLMATSFADASFDLVVTSDVMEHVRKPMAAFREICRILRPGGTHVFTIPFLTPVPEVTRSRVDTSGPEDRHLLPPVYHGSGSGGLSLVYTDFGRDLRVLLREIGMSLEVLLHAGGAEGKDTVAATMISRRLADQ